MQPLTHWHHQGRHRHRRHRLEHPRTDLRAEACLRKLVFLARHLPAGHLRAAAHPSDPGRVHLPVRRPARRRARRQGLRRQCRRSAPAADRHAAWLVQQDRPAGEVPVLGDADAQALRPVLGDPQHEGAEAGGGRGALGQARGHVPAAAGDADSYLSSRSGHPSLPRSLLHVSQPARCTGSGSVATSLGRNDTLRSAKPCSSDAET